MFVSMSSRLRGNDGTCVQGIITEPVPGDGAILALPHPNTLNVDRRYFNGFPESFQRSRICDSGGSLSSATGAGVGVVDFVDMAPR